LVPHTKAIYVAEAKPRRLKERLPAKNLDVIKPIESIVAQLQLGLIIAPLFKFQSKTSNPQT
jgi:hypothetical protein